MKRKINIITHLINSLLFITMGLIFIIKRNEMFAITIKVIGVLLLITVVFKIINIDKNRHCYYTIYRTRSKYINKLKGERK